MTIDNTEFVAVVHELISNSEECIAMLNILIKNDVYNKEVLMAASSLLNIHIKLITTLTEQNASILDIANGLIEKIEDIGK